MTKLEEFLKANGIRPGQLAREACIAASYLRSIRNGDVEPRLKMAMRIRCACERLLMRYIAIEELF